MFICFELTVFKVHSESGNMLSPHDNQFMTRQHVYKTHIQKKREKKVFLTLQGKRTGQI